MVILKLLLGLFCIKFVTSESPNLPRISFDLTIPLNKVLSGNISKSDFRNTFISTNFFDNDTGHRETVVLLYVAGINAKTKPKYLSGYFNEISCGKVMVFSFCKLQIVM